MTPADLVFDLDGTISDPLIGISRCINHALAAHGHMGVPQSSVAGLVGPPLDSAFKALVPEASDRDVEALVSTYRERYAELGYAENTIYEGVADALVSLSAQGLRLGLCTSKRADFAEKILDLFGIRDHFEFVDGGDIGVSKVHQLRGLKACGQVGARSKMIGDRAVDIVAARQNELSSIGVLWGYGSREELEQAGAGSILEHTRELLQLRR